MYSDILESYEVILFFRRILFNKTLLPLFLLGIPIILYFLVHIAEQIWDSVLVNVPKTLGAILFKISISY
jgi:hypothetical protein